MNTSLIIDLLIVAVLAVNLFLGWSKGVVRALLTLTGTILAIAVASQIGAIASGFIVEQVIRPATHAAIAQRVTELDISTLTAPSIDAITQTIDAIENDLVREKAKELLSTINFPTEDLNESVQDSVLRISTDVADTVLRGAVRDVLSAIVCALSFAVLSLALRPVIWMVEQVFKLPLLKQINQIGGLALGVLKGILLVMIAVWALRCTGICLTDEVVAGSYLLKLCVQSLSALGLAAAPIF